MVRDHSGSRATRQVCDVCQTFAPDESGRCPLCAPARSSPSGDVLNDLAAQDEPGDPAVRESTGDALDGLLPGERHRDVA